VVRNSAASARAELTSFVGRRAELTTLRRRLASDRLVTLTGPGGVGKTRLALRAMAPSPRSTDFPDGVAFAGLAELRDGDLLANTVADRLGLHDRSSRPSVDVIVDHLRNRRQLLVLDNCEHLIDAAARFVQTLLESCSRVVVLATSRQSLGVDGERVMLVPPLPVPAAGEPANLLTACDSVALLVDRATAVTPSFQIAEDNADTVIRLSQALDGLPLAIELAAVRLRSLSVSQVADRLHERLGLLTVGKRAVPDRHRSLRALIDWSYELCTEPEQLLWQRASVFSGGFDLDAAAGVCAGAGLDADSVLAAIDGLVDKSILLTDDDQGRYRMLETVRQYGDEQLRAADDWSRVARLHRDWFRELTARFEADWIGPAQVAWIERLRGEHANLRVALEFCATSPADAAIGLRMATSFQDYWGIRGLHSEARTWLDKVLDIAPADAPGRPGALRMAGWFALLQGDLAVGLARLAEAAESGEAIGDDIDRAYLNKLQGYVSFFSADLPKATELFGSAARQFRESGELRGELWAQYNHGLVVGLGGDIDGGRAILRECLAVSLARDERFFQSWAWFSVCCIEYMFGDLGRAEEAGLTALRLQRPLGDRLGMACAINVMAGVVLRAGDVRRAVRLAGIADSVWTAIGASPDYYLPLAGPHHELIAKVRVDLGDAEFDREFAVGAALSVDQAMAYALGEDGADSADSSDPAVSDQPRSVLTKREAEIADLIADGLTNREIAGRAGIAVRTAETHVDHILAKLGFHNRTQIAAWVSRSRQHPDS
jgi:non-specific serine/threonine protein kinase